ncbi:MAG: hypothetical protein IPL29_07970 [Propionivibrio sp.]|nr:hypothetical protein [Propionivibrio sp.]
MLSIPPVVIIYALLVNDLLSISFKIIANLLIIRLVLRDLGLLVLPLVLRNDVLLLQALVNLLTLLYLTGRQRRLVFSGGISGRRRAFAR